MPSSYIAPLYNANINKYYPKYVKSNTQVCAARWSGEMMGKGIEHNNPCVREIKLFVYFG